jgi:lipopolysaccharide assembly outer membrane protein LptD (OstA)
MKLLPLGILLIAAFPAATQKGSAQDQAQFERWACLSSSKCQLSGDARPETQEFARTAKVGRLWPEEHTNIIATFRAGRIDSDQNVFRLRGNAEIATTTVTLKADEADYHWDTGEIEARGSVHVKPIAYNPNSGLRQFGVR